MFSLFYDKNEIMFDDQNEEKDIKPKEDLDKDYGLN